MVIGCEGLWGTVLSILVVYPLAYLAPGEDNGSFENPFDAFAMFANSSDLTVGSKSVLSKLAAPILKNGEFSWVNFHPNEF